MRNKVVVGSLAAILGAGMLLSSCGDSLQSRSGKSLSLSQATLLTESAEAYVGSKGKTLRDYTPIGVQINIGYGSFPSLQSVVPPKTEAVVDYRVFVWGSTGSYGIIETGTALVPK